MQELDLTKPGKLWAVAENQENCTFHIVLPSPKYNKASLSKDPTIAAADQLMRPFEVSGKDVDGQGRAICDLKTTGRADQIMEAVIKHMKAGNPCPPTVTGVVIANALASNALPAKQLADVIDFKLIAPPQMDLKAVKDYITAQNYKAGDKYFLADLQIDGPMPKCEIKSDPPKPISVDGGPSGTGVVILEPQSGKKYRIKVEAHFSVKKESRSKDVYAFSRWVPGGWRTGGAQATYDAALGMWIMTSGSASGVSKSTMVEEREIWDGGNVTLTCAGMASQKDIKKSVKFRSEGWASGWLVTKPPRPFSHNVC